MRENIQGVDDGFVHELAGAMRQVVESEVAEAWSEAVYEIRMPEALDTMASKLRIAMVDGGEVANLSLGIEWAIRISSQIDWMKTIEKPWYGLRVYIYPDDRPDQVEYDYDKGCYDRPGFYDIDLD